MNAARLTLWCKGLLALAVVLLLGWITSASVHAQAENPSPVPLAPAAQLSATGLLTDIRAVAVGGAHSCALTSSGGVKCWGDNSYGQLGDGSQADHLTPVVVTGLTAGVQSVSAGNTYTCAVTSSGGVKCWGYNFDGQLGDGTTTDRLTPVDVNGLTGGVQAVVAGSDHTCALTIDGGIKCWGDNSYGQLGDGTWTDRLAPVDVSGLTGGVQAVTIGQKHTCALTTAGGVQCWGRNYYGELGDGTHIYSRTPVDVSGLTSGVQAIAAGQKHTCALTTAGGVQCWGNNEFGQLGDGTTFERLEPEEVSGLTSGVQAITAGAIHTCALTTAGGVKCWGDNGAGQLGDGTHSSRKTPIDVMTLTEGIQVLAAGSGHTCALTTAGGVKCWGDNRQGQLGDGRTDRLTPVDITGLSEGVQILAAGGGHTCALTAAGGVQCWGLNSSGQLGDGTANSRTTPADVSGLTSGVQAITAGGSHTCALTNTGGVKCWGYNFNGQLGDGTTTDRWTPVDVIGLTDGVQAIAADTLHTCALTVGGGVKCWGWNIRGQLGDGTTTDRPTPTDVSDLTNGVQAIATGETHTCALMAAGGVKCWGANSIGQLGDGTQTDHLTPVDVINLIGDVQAITAGETHTCALTTAGGVKCWGNNDYGQAGSDHSAIWGPVNVGGLTSGVQAIAAGKWHTCALTTAGGVKCWGSDFYGQLGDGMRTDRYMPMDVYGLTGGVQRVAAGEFHICALTTGGVQCWGSNRYGQLGINPGWTPVDVVDPTSWPADAAGLESQMANLTVMPGVALTIWVNIRNTGDTTWQASSGYGWFGAHQWFGQTGFIPGPIAPDQVWSFTRDIIAPSDPGVYGYGFVLQHSGVEFGPPVVLEIAVQARESVVLHLPLISK